MTEGAPSGQRPVLDVSSLASIGARAVARIVDTVLFGAIASAIAWFVLGFLEADFRFRSVMLSWTFAIAGAIYEVVLTKTRGQTLGKMAMRIRVVQTPEGSMPSWRASVVRYAVPAIATWLAGFAMSLLEVRPGVWTTVITTLIPPAVFLTAALDRNRQGIHDKLARTMVLSDRQAS